MDFASSETKINLMRAFAGESQARNRYNMASSTAKSEGHFFIANLFDYTACQEQAHATVFYGFLKEVNNTNFDINASYPINCYDTTQKHLEAAMHNEREEYESAYKNFSIIAKNEGFDRISNAFDKIATIEKVHAERFEKLLEMLTGNTLYTGEENTVWVCTNCGHIHVGPSAPELCPVCSHQKGYFAKDCFKNDTPILM